MYSLIRVSEPVLVDLGDDSQSLEDFARCLEQVCEQTPALYCPHCNAWIPFGGLRCWRCRGMLAIVGA